MPVVVAVTDPPGVAGVVGDAIEGAGEAIGCTVAGVDPKDGDGAPAGVAPNDGAGAPAGVAAPSGTPCATVPGSGVLVGVGPSGLPLGAVEPGPIMPGGGVPEDSIGCARPSAESVRTSS